MIRPICRLVVIGILAAPLVRAESPIPFRVHYDAPPECPDARAFTAGITGRSDRVRISATGDAAMFEVSLRRDDHYVGQIRMLLPGEPERARAVDGEVCAEVADALALIGALALDPEARSEATAPPPAALPKAPERPVPAPPREPGLHWQFGFGAHLVPFTGAIPEPGIGIGASIEAASSGDTWAPSIRLIAEHVGGGVVSRNSGSARFSLTDMVAELCPLRIPPSGSWSARPCAGFEIGALHAEAVGVELSKRPTRLWVAPRASGRFDWLFAPPLLAALEVGLAFPLKRQHYAFDSGESVFDEPTLIGFASVGLGVRFR